MPIGNPSIHFNVSFCNLFTSSKQNSKRRPHPFGYLLLLRSDGICVNCCGLQSCMSHPLLGHVKRNLGGCCLDTETVPYAFRARVEAVNASPLHDLFYAAPGRRP